MNPRSADLVRSARHEAAHAVVSVQLGLPLASTDIRRRTVDPNTGERMRDAVSVGFTTLRRGSAEGWRAALPDGAAREKLEALGAQCAAGVVAETEAGLPLSAPEHREDLVAIVQIAGALGLGTSNEDEAVRRFMAECFQRAADVLFADDGEAWAAVTRALLERRVLNAEEVARCIPGVGERRRVGGVRGHNLDTPGS